MSVAATSDPIAPGPLSPGGANGIKVTITGNANLDTTKTRVVAEFRSGYQEVVYQDGDYTSQYGGPTPPGPPGFVVPSPVQTLTVKRVGGWPTSFTLHVFGATVS